MAFGLCFCFKFRPFTPEHALKTFSRQVSFWGIRSVCHMVRIDAVDVRLFLGFNCSRKLDQVATGRHTPCDFLVLADGGLASFFSSLFLGAPFLDARRQGASCGFLSFLFPILRCLQLHTFFRLATAGPMHRAALSYIAQKKGAFWEPQPLEQKNTSEALHFGVCSGPTNITLAWSMCRECGLGSSIPSRQGSRFSLVVLWCKRNPQRVWSV